jgi:hypothetical protein
MDSADCRAAQAGTADGGIDVMIIDVASDEVALWEEAPVWHTTALGRSAPWMNARRWPTPGVPMLCVSIDQGPDTLFGPIDLPHSSGWMRLGSVPLPSTRRERFVHHVAHGLLMHYPVHHILAFAFKDLFTPLRRWSDAQPDDPSDHVSLRVTESARQTGDRDGRQL